MSEMIVIEGIEGAGKSTAIALVTKVLKSLGVQDILMTREPGGTPIAEKLRELLKYGCETEEMSSQTELLLMYASRVQLLDGVIKPALSNGTWVISDRHDMSSFAYQGGGRQAPLEFIKTLSHNCLGSIRPSLTLYLDISPELGLERARGRGALDRIEKEDMAFFHRTREMYLSLAKDTSKVITIDASQSVDKVKQQITTALTGWYERRFS